MHFLRLLDDHLGVSLSFRDIFEAPSVSAWAELILGKLQDDAQKTLKRVGNHISR